MPNELPLDRSGEDGREVEVVVRAARDRAIELLRGYGLQPGHQGKPQEMAQGKPHRALPVTIDILAIDLHGGAMTQDAFKHGGHFRGVAPFEL